MRNKKRCAWLLCALWMGVIFLMSALPGEESGNQSEGIVEIILSTAEAVLGEGIRSISPDRLEWFVRKGAHMVEYAVLLLLYRRALGLSGVKRPGLCALVMCVLYAATDEYQQRFVPGRGPAAADVMIDAMGSAAAWALIWAKNRAAALCGKKRKASWR